VIKKILQHLTNNIGLKIASILMAMALWLVVVNMDNPNVPRTYTIPVTVVNAEIVENMGKVYEIKENNNKATFTVTGKRSILDKMGPDDFAATADLQQIDLSQESEIKLVPIEVTALKNRTQLDIDRRTVNLSITLEDLKKEQLPITVQTFGEPADGYAIGDNITTEPNLLTFSGPASVVSRISKVVARVNVQGATSDVSSDVGLEFFDEVGYVVESDQVRLEQEIVNVSVEVLATKNVPVRCIVSGTPKEGYKFQDVVFEPKEVWIKGKEKDLNEVPYIEIKEELSVEGLDQNTEVTCEVAPLLPEGVSLIKEEEGKIAIQLMIEKMETRSVEIPVKNIRIDNLPTNYNLEFINNVGLISVMGLAEDLSEFNVSMAEVFIDVTGLAEGTQDVDLQVSLEGGVSSRFESAAKSKIRVRISKKTLDEVKEPEESDNKPDNSSNNDNSGSNDTDQPDTSQTPDNNTNPDESEPSNEDPEQPDEEQQAPNESEDTMTDPIDTDPGNGEGTPPTDGNSDENGSSEDDNTNTGEGTNSANTTN
jgi:YbbR domain-containing protein